MVSKTASSEMKAKAGDKKHAPDQSKRDFLTLTTTAVCAVGAATCALPLVNSMNPAADTMAMASVEVDISKLTPGQAMKVMWQGKPVFIRYRTPEEIAQTRDVAAEELIDPETDQVRVKKDDYIVVIGVCTHLGCVPVGQQATDVRGDYGGWFCPCHGSHYDVSGRIRKGPAPKNLTVPPYEFVSNTTIRIG